jgi:hypothetical protein
VVTFFVGGCVTHPEAAIKAKQIRIIIINFGG